MLYYVRRAEVSDLKEIKIVIENGRQTLREQGIPQWMNNDGPTDERLMEDLSLGEGYCLIEEDHIIGYGTITLGEQPGYEEINKGDWLPSDKYSSIHRFAIHSKIKEKGKAQFFISHLISGSIALGFKDIRIDTHPSNLRMQRVIEKSGFHYRGEINLDVTDGKRKAYQLIIN